MRSLKVSGIIHLFAVLHAVVALSCHLAGINDELVLTLLTIVLIVLICLKRGLNVEFTAASVIVVNVIGYLLGTGGAQLIELLLHASPVVHAVSTPRSWAGASSGSPSCSAAATTRRAAPRPGRPASGCCCWPWG